MSHSVACKIFGVFGFLIGVLVVLMGGLASYARSSKSTLDGMFPNPQDIPTNGPWVTMFIGFVLISLAVRVFRGSWLSAVGFVAVNIGFDVAASLIPAIRLEAPTPFDIVDVVIYACLLGMLALVLVTKPAQATSR